MTLGVLSNWKDGVDTEVGQVVGKQVWDRIGISFGM